MRFGKRVRSSGGNGGRTVKSSQRSSPRVTSRPHYSDGRGDRGDVPPLALPTVGFMAESKRARIATIGMTQSSKTRGLASTLARRAPPGGQRRRPGVGTHFDLFLVMAPAAAEAKPSGPCPGATVAAVEHGVPLVLPKWVHHPWAQHEDGQDQGAVQSSRAPHASLEPVGCKGPWGHSHPGREEGPREPEAPAGPDSLSGIKPYQTKPRVFQHPPEDSRRA